MAIQLYETGHQLKRLTQKTSLTQSSNILPMYQVVLFIRTFVLFFRIIKFWNFVCVCQIFFQIAFLLNKCHNFSPAPGNIFYRTIAWKLYISRSFLFGQNPPPQPFPVLNAVGQKFLTRVNYFLAQLAHMQPDCHLTPCDGNIKALDCSSSHILTDEYLRDVGETALKYMANSF